MAGFDGENGGGRRVTEVELAGLVGVLNDIFHQKQGLDMALALGELYLLWKEDGLRVSIRALCAHPAAVLRRSSLTGYVNVALQARTLDPCVVPRLGLSLHVALLSCDPERKPILARRAADEGWSVADMREAVAGNSRGHRRRVRELADNVTRAAESFGEEARQSLDQLTPAEREELAHRVEAGAREIAERLRAVKDSSNSGSFSPV